MKFGIKTRPEPGLAAVAAYREAGADIAIMNLPHGAPVVLLDDLAQQLEDLA